MRRNLLIIAVAASGVTNLVWLFASQYREPERSYFKFVLSPKWNENCPIVESMVRPQRCRMIDLLEKCDAKGVNGIIYSTATSEVAFLPTTAGTERVILCLAEMKDNFDQIELVSEVDAQTH